LRRSAGRSPPTADSSSDRPTTPLHARTSIARPQWPASIRSRGRPIRAGSLTLRPRPGCSRTIAALPSRRRRRDADAVDRRADDMRDSLASRPHLGASGSHRPTAQEVHGSSPRAPTRLAHLLRRTQGPPRPAVRSWTWEPTCPAADPITS
jgi:hypothetical protein